MPGPAGLRRGASAAEATRRAAFWADFFCELFTCPIMFQGGRRIVSRPSSASERYPRRHFESGRVADVDIDVVRTCAWAFPQRMRSADAPKEVVRSPELNSVRQAHRQNPQDVTRFRRELTYTRCTISG